MVWKLDYFLFDLHFIRSSWMEFMLEYVLVNANCVLQNISCCPDLMSENTKKITFHEYLRVLHKGKSSCRTENKLCMFIFTIQLAKCCY